jgi:hypothetical protein
MLGSKPSVVTHVTIEYPLTASMFTKIQRTAKNYRFCLE